VPPGDEVLMDTDCSLDLTPAAKQIAQRKMGFDRVAVDLKHLDEGIDRLVRLLIQQMIESAKIDRADLAHALLLLLARAASRGQPTGGRRQGQQHKEQFLHPLNALLWAAFAGF
jgi:hypothetical protein